LTDGGWHSLAIFSLLLNSTELFYYLLVNHLATRASKPFLISGGYGRICHNGGITTFLIIVRFTRVYTENSPLYFQLAKDDHYFSCLVFISGIAVALKYRLSQRFRKKRSCQRKTGSGIKISRTQNPPRFLLNTE
jgi:hypothetical protein